MEFSSPSGSQATLRSGALIPTRSPAANFAKSTIQTVRDWCFQFRAMHPVAFVVVAAATGLLVLLVAFRLLRKLACCSAILLLGFLSAGVSLPAFAGDVGFTREALRNQQQHFRDRLNASSEQLAVARDKIGSGLPGPAERHLLIAWITLDAAQIENADALEQINSLKPVPLAFSRTRQIQFFADSLAQLRSRHAAIARELAALRNSQPPTVTNDWQALGLYDRRHADFLQRFQARIVRPDDIISNLSRTGLVPRLVLSAALGTDTPVVQALISAHPSPNVVTQILTVTRTNVLRVAAQPVTNTHYVTNIQRVVVDRPVIVTNTVLVTNALLKVASTTASSTNMTATTEASTTAPPKVAQLVTLPRQPKSPLEESSVSKLLSHGIAAKVVVPVVVTVLVAAMLLFGLTARARHYPVVFQMAEAGTGRTHEITLGSSDELIVLDNVPHPAPKGLCGESPAIGRDWLGRAILLPFDGTTLNDNVVSKSSRLNVGDRIAIHSSEPNSAWIFGGIILEDLQSLDPLSETTAN